MFNEKIKPPMVLTLICLIVCGLLVFAYEMTYVDTTGQITEKLQDSLTEIYGGYESFEMLLDKDGSVLTSDGVTSIISDGENYAFEIITDGYSSDGLHLLVGVNESGVTGISVIEIGETPGLGTKIQDSSFLSQFKGVIREETIDVEAEPPADAKAVWGTREEINALKLNSAFENTSGFTLDAVTGATRSSNGVYNAVKIALDTYEELKGGVA